MTTHDQSLPLDPALDGESTNPLLSTMRSIARRVVAWMETCADYYAAAAMYEQLSGLSDAELARRGLTRATLARHVVEAHDRLEH
jgi:hypothetical protein